MVAAAVIGAAVVGATGSAVAGAEESSATKSATNASISAQQAALTSQQAISQPYANLGTTNLPTYQSLLTGGGGPNAGANIESTLQNTPGYQATLQTGTEATQRAAAASGLNLSGNQVTATETYGAQLGDQTYQQQLNNLLQPIQLGQAAAAGQAANIGTSASNIANLTTAQGTNTANIDANEIAGLTKASSTAGNQLLTYNTLNGLNNPSSTSTPTYTPTGVGNFDGSTGTPAQTYNTPTPGYS